MRFADDKLYACGEEGGLVAGHVVYDPKAGVIQWFMPGGRQRVYDVEEVLEDSTERFAFLDSYGRKFVLFSLTPDYYNKHIRRPGQPQCVNYEALMEAYEESLRQGHA